MHGNATRPKNHGIQYATVKNVNKIVMGKIETAPQDNKKTKWHGHVTALTVAPDYRRLGLAKNMMDLLEDITEKMFVFNTRADN